MHVGHCRGAVFGDALANLLVFAGYDVTREYYINDAGGQVNVLAKSAFLRYREALGEKIGAIPEGFYPGDYLKPVGEALAKEHGAKLLDMPEAEWLPLVRSFAIRSHDGHDPRRPRRAQHPPRRVFLGSLADAGGHRQDARPRSMCCAPRGSSSRASWKSPRVTTTTSGKTARRRCSSRRQFGDDEDRAIQKSDGSYTYFAGDIAYHYDKLQRGYLHLINVFGADHIGYISRMKAAVAALSDKKAEFDIKVVNLVKLYKNGEPFKMSKRAGTFVTLRDVVDEVGRDPVRFMMLYRKNQEAAGLRLCQGDRAIEGQSGLLRAVCARPRRERYSATSKEQMPGLDVSLEALENADLSDLDGCRPKRTSYASSRSSRSRSQAPAMAHEPHRIAFYLYDLASAFHGLWTRGNDSPHLRFIQSNDGVATSARLALVAATKQVITSGLKVLGVEAPDAMR